MRELELHVAMGGLAVGDRWPETTVAGELTHTHTHTQFTGGTPPYPLKVSDTSGDAAGL